MTEFSWPVRVYYEDTDAGGVVYHANYLAFMERARTEWLRSLGFGQRELAAEVGVLFAVRSMELDFLKPARFDDELTVTATIDNLARARIDFLQEIRSAAGEVLCRGRVRVACIDGERFRPCAIPEVIRNAAEAT
ncbi:acyl-CoA thioester hydrolase [Thiohalospira halophila DSM 15071]|uniref:Acyl-CoA thioester hydrolase n=1 Tax=Thiohalospira halophila DSM 15071 TaxID=1123397 RepID=A0A1I1QM18_9GAMM|nr:acyl-CoA thioester hydrolase [Thiohalospira halophila DSM 15071]